MTLINTQNAGSDLPLSRYVRQRRENLGLTIMRASQLATFDASQFPVI